MNERLDAILKDRRRTLALARTAPALGDWFRAFARDLAQRPARAERADPTVIRAFNLGHDKFRRLAPTLANAPASLPAVTLDATLGVVLVRSVEIAHCCRSRPHRP